MNEPNDFSDTDPPYLWLICAVGALIGFGVSVLFPLPWFGG